MATYQFKTNINCSGCVARIRPVLDEAEGIREWSVDTNNPGKPLTVDTDLAEAKVKDLVEAAGFKAEKI